MTGPLWDEWRRVADLPLGEDQWNWKFRPTPRYLLKIWWRNWIPKNCASHNSIPVAAPSSAFDQWTNHFNPPSTKTDLFCIDIENMKLITVIVTCLICDYLGYIHDVFHFKKLVFVACYISEAHPFLSSSITFRIAFCDGHSFAAFQSKTQLSKRIICHVDFKELQCLAVL